MLIGMEIPKVKYNAQQEHMTLESVWLSSKLHISNQ